jgi:outer membrane protein assembly factor BamB
LNATTGEEIWIHANLRGIARRGVNYWESADRRDRRLLFQMNNYLQAIDARTGKSILTFGKNGLVDLKEGLTRDSTAIRAQSNTPGKIFENLILLGSAVGEGYLSPPGHLRAYNVVTGALAWTFHTIPQPRIRIRHLAERRIQVRRRCEHVGRDLGRREARNRILSNRLAHLRLLRRRSDRREPVRELPAGAPLGVDRLAAEQGGADAGVPRGSQRMGMIVTSTGLLFATVKDGKVRAYSADDGKILWTGELPHGTEGLPAMYEANGRQYLVVCATTGLTWGPRSREGGGWTQGDIESGGKKGAYVVFALDREASRPGAGRP